MFNLSEKSVLNTGSLPAGEYTGYLVAAVRDADNKQWLTLGSSSGSHLEQSELDVSAIPVGSAVRFVIESRNGVGVQMRGLQYRLWNGATRQALSKFDTLENTVRALQEGNYPLAGLYLTDIQIR